MIIRHNITLDEDISRELEVIAAELNEKKSSIIGKALTAYFDLLDLRIARKRMKDLKNGKSRVVDADEVWKELGI